MYKLFYAPGTASLAIHWMLVELDVPFELSLVDFAAKAQKSPEYLLINPSGQVPTLMIDGAPHGECAALLMLLAERHPEARFAPPAGSAPRAAYVETMFWLANGLLPAFRLLFYTADLAGPEQEEDLRERVRARIGAGFARLDRLLSDGRTFLLGEEMSAVDFLVTMLIRWSRNMPSPAEALPHLAGYAKRMKARPALRLVHAREGLADWI